MKSRRTLLRATASGALVAVAGCTDDIEGVLPEEGGWGRPLRQDDPPPALDEEAVERAGEVGRRVRESVVYLQTDLRRGARATGTGFVYGDRDHVVTNAHNVRGSGTFDLWTLDRERHEARVVDHVDDGHPDVALLRVDGLDLEPLPGGGSDGLESGQPLLQVGHPSIMGNWVITAGPMGEPSRFTDRLRTHVPGMQGNSGSPLVDLDGTVVGLTFAVTPPGDRGPDDPPPGPHSDRAHTEVVGRAASLHVPVEAVDERYEAWT